MGMGGRISPFLLEMACGLYIPSPGCSRSLDQGRSAKMYVVTEVREISFCKSKGGKQNEKIGLQGLHHGRSDPRNDILLLCA